MHAQGSVGRARDSVLATRCCSPALRSTIALLLSAPLTPLLAGLTFALAASPCSTPILATLLAYVSTTRDPVTGAQAAKACMDGHTCMLRVVLLLACCICHAGV